MDGRRLGILSFWKFIHMIAFWLSHASLKGLQLQKVAKDEFLLVVGTTLYPQRPGQTECDYYMKTGECKFGERCKFHHPIDRSASTTKPAPQETFKLTLAGLPRREGAVHCPYYMKTGTCRYGATCKFDHPPPAEVMAIAASQGTSPSAGVQDAGAV